ncbi:MAG: lactate utilization protein [Desulfarculus sp.]|nr:lactate utilization protein [Desulfarculus sp.]
MDYELFKAKAEGVSAEVHRLPGRAAALAFILDFLKANGVADSPGAFALWAPCPFLAGLDQAELARQVPGLSFDVTREKAAQTLVGINQVTWGLANTGTIAGDATAIEGRLVSTLPWIHLAILPTAGLLPDLPALIERVDPAAMAYLALVTGPSRTADIERVLTIGVHGPERLVIVCVDDLEEVNR